MIKFTVYQKEGSLVGFEASGHAMYSKEGSDIVCAAVSALTINCVNSIEQLTDESFTSDYDPESDTLSFMLNNSPGRDAALLLSALSLGIQSIEDNEDFEPYIDIIFKEV